MNSKICESRLKTSFSVNLSNCIEKFKFLMKASLFSSYVIFNKDMYVQFFSKTSIIFEGIFNFVYCDEINWTSPSIYLSLECLNFLLRCNWKQVTLDILSGHKKFRQITSLFVYVAIT